MKKCLMIFAVATGFTLSAQATLICKGLGKDEKVSMSILDLSKKSVPEGKRAPVAVRISETYTNAKGYEDEKVLFAGVVAGKSEDVLWSLKSKDGKSLNAGLYMDELYDQTISVDSREINLSCERY